jgi:hypothetical protein
VAKRGPVLTKGAVKMIEQAVDLVFDKAKVRILGPQTLNKRLYVTYNRHFSLPGLFESAAREEGVIPSLDTLAQILKVAGNYIDSTRERTKAQVIKEVQAFLHEAHQKGVDTDVQTVLTGTLTDVFTQASHSMRKIIEAEANTTKNVGILEGVIKVNAAAGIEDPVVYFVVVRDRALCEECRRLHLLEDQKTPRVWKLSEVGHGYHKKGEPNPKMPGLHPHCRCTLVTLLPGYGFSDAGFVTFIAPKHDEYARQHGSK